MLIRRRTPPQVTDEKNVLASISPDEALTVLNELTKDAGIRKKAEDIALAAVGEVAVEAVADEVFYELDAMAVEDVWDKSGATRDGYVDPGEYAWKLLEDTLERFEEQLRKCRELSLIHQAKLQCMGILKGIWRFSTESQSEFKDWAVDAPGENMARVFEEWEKGSESRQDIAEVKRFMESLIAGTTA